MRLRTARSAAEMDQFRELWDDLHQRSESATFFQSFGWNRLAATLFSERESPYVVAAESDSGRALIPAAVSRAGLTLLGESMSDYRDVLSIGDPAALGAAWVKLAELGLPLVVTALRGDRVRDRWRALKPEPFVHAPQVRGVEIAADEFASRHSRLGRTLRILSREGISLHHYCGDAGGVVRWIYQQKAQQQDLAGNLFADSTRVDFMLAFCKLAGSDCDIFTFERGEPIAALVTFRDRQMRRFYTIYFDPAWGRLSPGTCLTYEITRRSLAEGLDCDYMTGEQPHKSRFMTSMAPLFKVNARAELLAVVGKAEPSLQRAA